MKSVVRSGMLLGAMLTAGALVVGPASAGAARRPATSAKVVGTVKIDKADPSVAHVLAQYRCTLDHRRVREPSLAAIEQLWDGTETARPD